MFARIEKKHKHMSKEQFKKFLEEQLGQVPTAVTIGFVGYGQNISLESLQQMFENYVEQHPDVVRLKKNEEGYKELWVKSYHLIHAMDTKDGHLLQKSKQAVKEILNYPEKK